MRVNDETANLAKDTALSLDMVIFNIQRERDGGGIMGDKATLSNQTNHLVSTHSSL